RAGGIDEAPARGPVRGIEQAWAGNRDVAWIAVVGLAIGEGELDRFRDGVDVVRRVVAERGEVDPVQNLQHLKERRPLAPEAAGQDFVGPEPRTLRRLEADTEPGQVLASQEPALSLLVRDEPRRH